MPQFPGDKGVVPPSFQSGHKQAQKGTGHDLGIKGLGRGDGHFDIPATAGIDDAVDFKGQVGIASVDDRQCAGAPLADHIDGPVRVRGGAGLADGDHQGVFHHPARIGFVQHETAELRGLEGADLKGRIIQVIGQQVAQARAATPAVPCPMK